MVEYSTLLGADREQAETQMLETLQFETELVEVFKRLSIQKPIIELFPFRYLLLGTMSKSDPKQFNR